jgi:glutaryl-CoA dehydrogenase
MLAVLPSMLLCAPVLRVRLIEGRGMNCYALLDPLDSQSLLTDQERALRDETARAVDTHLLPIAADAFEKGEMPDAVVKALAEMGAFGGFLHGVGPAGYGLMMQEIERADSGFRSCASVQSSLVMWPIHTFGSEAQKAKWLPSMRKGEALGCFALTEPGSGSDPGSMTTRAVRDGSKWRITGHKRWSTNGTKAAVALVWAKTEGDDAKGIRGFLVERGQFTARPIPGKMSLRASDSSELFLDGGIGEPLEQAQGLGAPLKCLNEARFGIAWGAVGAASACFAAARDYVVERKQFGKPLGAFQLVQEKLAGMYTDIGLAQLACIQIARLKERGQLSPVQVSFAKRAHVSMALDAARAARDLLGANGITLAHAPIRHLLNLETVKTYEGTHDVHTLVLGRHITGLDAFS